MDQVYVLKKVITRFKRRLEKKFFNKDFYIISPEDLLIIKLKWYRDSNSERHYLDALSIYELQKDKLDVNYINKWTKHQRCYKLFKDIRVNKPCQSLMAEPWPRK